MKTTKQRLHQVQVVGHAFIFCYYFWSRRIFCCCLLFLLLLSSFSPFSFHLSVSRLSTPSFRFCILFLFVFPKPLHVITLERWTSFGHSLSFTLPNVMWQISMVFAFGTTLHVVDVHPMLVHALALLVWQYMAFW